jgi:hypothetical protein
MPLPPKYLLPLILAVCSIVTNPGHAQTAAPAAVPVPAPSAASAPAADSSAPAASAPAPRAARPAASGAAPAAWDRPADGPPVFAEDFESGAIDGKKWTSFATGNATVTVEQDFVAHGKNALHVHYPAGSRNSIAFIAMTVPDSLREHFYGRAYVYMQTIPDGHCVLMTAGSSGFPTSNFLEIGMRQKQFQPSFQQNGPGVPRYEDHPLQGVPPAGRWFCLEWEYNDKPDQIVMWIDGKLAVNEKFSSQDHSKTSELTGGFIEFALGFRDWSVPTNDVDIYYDDIAIGDKPIGQLTPVAASTPPAPAAAAAAPAAATDSSAAK